MWFFKSPFSRMDEELLNITVTAVILQKLKKRYRPRSSSSKSSSDDEDELALCKMARRTEGKREEKIKNFVNIAVNYSMDDFQRHFRISRTTFEELLVAVSPDYIFGRRAPYPVKDSLLLTIWGLATQETFREIGSRFNVSEGHAYRIYMKYCIKITCMKDKYIVWPRGQQAQLNIAKFNTLRGDNSFPNVFGCVDGTHLAIPGPTNDNSYYNRKGFHSLHLQGICDAKAKFINVYCGWPGSAHDARVWQFSQVFRSLEENPQELLPAGSYLLGDSAYPLATYLLTPFKDNGHLTRKQRRFNARLSSTRVIIEQAFGRLKGVFRRLKYLNILNLPNAKYVVFAACILHNLCIEDGENIEFVSDINDDGDASNDDNEIQEEPREAVQFRINLMNQIIN